MNCAILIFLTGGAFLCRVRATAFALETGGRGMWSDASFSCISESICGHRIGFSLEGIVDWSNSQLALQNARRRNRNSREIPG